MPELAAMIMIAEKATVRPAVVTARRTARLGSYPAASSSRKRLTMNRL